MAKDSKKERPTPRNEESSRQDANAGMPSQNDSNWAREHETRQK